MAAGFEDPYLTCPLDEVHRIRKSRMQCHLTRCLKNHNLTDKIKCPFNSLHIVDPNEMNHHMTVCESNASVTLQRYDRSDKKCFSGVISEQEAMAQLEAAFGSFSNEVEHKHTIDTPGYDPIQANIDNPLFRTLNCESKSKRKEFRLRERKRIAAIEAEKGKKLVEPTRDECSKHELKPLRSQSVLAAYVNDEGFQQQDQVTINNYSPPQGIVCENEEQKLEVLSNVHNEIRNKTEDRVVEENPFTSSANIDQVSIENDFDDIAKKLEFLSQKEYEIQQEKRKLMMKLTERATQARIASQSLLEKVSDKPARKNTFKINSNDPNTTKSIHSLPTEKATTAVESRNDVKPAYSDVEVIKSPTPTFELSSHYQSSAWNIVAKTKLDTSNTSTALKNVTTSKTAEVPVVHTIVQPVAQTVPQPVAQDLPTEEKPPVTPSSEWTTVSRSKKVSTLLDSSVRKVNTKSRESSPVRETSSLEAAAFKETISTFQSQSTSLDVKTKSREQSPVRDAASWRNVDAPKETPSTLKSSLWNNIVVDNSQKTSPIRDDTPWNKVATLKDTSTSLESTPYTVMIRSKKVSSSQQCTQWMLAPEKVETIDVTPLSSEDMIASLKRSESCQLTSSEKTTKLDETLPVLESCSTDTKSKSRPVLKDSSQKPILVSTTITSSTISSSYSTMAKITKDKPSENSLMPLKSNVSPQEFLPIPHRTRTTASQNPKLAPVAGRGIIHALDEIKSQKKNDIVSRRLRPGSATSFSSSFDHIDIEGVYGYEETI